MFGDAIQKTMVLTHRGEEQEKEIRDHLGSLGLDPFFFRIQGRKHKKNNGKGKVTLKQILSHDQPDEVSMDIYKNHISMIQHAYEQGLDRVLFLEDDARFEKDIENIQIENITRFLKTQPWDIFYMGYCPWPYVVSFPISPNIVRIPSPMTAHSYVLSRSGMEKILNHHRAFILPLNQNVHIDRILADMKGLMKTGTYPSICFQNRDPGLYQVAREKIFLPFGFKPVSKTIEHVALLWPILTLFCIIFFVIKRYFRANDLLK